MITKDHPTNSLEVLDLHDNCFSGYVLLPVCNIFVSEIKMIDFVTFHHFHPQHPSLHCLCFLVEPLGNRPKRQKVDLDDGDEAFESNF